jgi:hypothetical protein
VTVRAYVEGAHWQGDTRCHVATPEVIELRGEDGRAFAKVTESRSEEMKSVARRSRCVNVAALGANGVHIDGYEVICEVARTAVGRTGGARREAPVSVPNAWSTPFTRTCLIERRQVKGLTFLNRAFVRLAPALSATSMGSR